MINILNVCNGNNLKIFRFLGTIINIIFIIVPIIIVVIGSVDLIKYLINSDNSNLKMILKRIIIGVSIFFILPITKFIISLSGIELSNACMECFVNYNSTVCEDFSNKKIIDECGYDLKSDKCCSKKYNSNGFIYKYNKISGTCDRN